MKTKKAKKMKSDAPSALDEDDNEYDDEDAQEPDSSHLRYYEKVPGTKVKSPPVQRSHDEKAKLPPVQASFLAQAALAHVPVQVNIGNTDLDMAIKVTL